jgi:pyruvate/oxaloacetate carboxyltransferase
VEFIDETLRDGPQSLWASRVDTATLVAIAPTLDRAGFSQAVVGSAALFEYAVKYLHEDPWERLRLLRRAMPRTPLRFLIRGRNLMGWQRFPDDVIDLFFDCLRRAGIDWVMVFDGLNDIRSIEHHFPAARKAGLKAAGIVCFSESPVHTDDYFVSRARELLEIGVDALLLYDASGVLTPERTRTLVPALLRAINGRTELEVTAHCATGLGGDCLVEALRAGVPRILTAGRPLAYADSIPATLDVVAGARALGRRVDLDLERVAEVDDYFGWVAYVQGKPVGRPVAYDPDAYQRYASHQIPGGMMSNMVRQLTEVGLSHRVPEILEEAARVRRELGYPVMVTPMSQLVGVQATLNVVEGERYRTIPEELRLYGRGHYGRPPVPIDPDVLDRILRPGDTPIDPAAGFLDPFLDRVRADRGPFASDEALLLAVFSSPETLAEYHRRQRPIDRLPALRTPLSALLGELSLRRGVRSLHVARPTPLTYGDAADVLAAVDACPPGWACELARGPLRVSVARGETGPVMPEEGTAKAGPVMPGRDAAEGGPAGPGPGAAA